MSVLPWRSWCDRPVPNAHRANATDKDIAIDTIPNANDILRRLLPAVCLGELTRNPLGARMSAPRPSCDGTEPASANIGIGDRAHSEADRRSTRTCAR